MHCIIIMHCNIMAFNDKKLKKESNASSYRIVNYHCMTLSVQYANNLYVVHPP